MCFTRTRFTRQWRQRSYVSKCVFVRFQSAFKTTNETDCDRVKFPVKTRPYYSITRRLSRYRRRPIMIADNDRRLSEPCPFGFNATFAASLPPPPPAGRRDLQYPRAYSERKKKELCAWNPARKLRQPTSRKFSWRSSGMTAVGVYRSHTPRRRRALRNKRPDAKDTGTRFVVGTNPTAANGENDRYTRGVRTRNQSSATTPDVRRLSRDRQLLLGLNSAKPIAGR